MTHRDRVRAKANLRTAKNISDYLAEHEVPAGLPVDRRVGDCTSMSVFSVYVQTTPEASRNISKC